MRGVFYFYRMHGFVKEVINKIIVSDGTDISKVIIILPNKIEDKSINLAERCQLRMRGNVSSFFINGKGGLPIWSSEVYLYDFIESKDEN